jgi:Ca-activated chloride channel family protein
MRAASVVGFGFVLAMFGSGCANRATVGPTIAKAPDTQAASSSSSDVAIAATDGPRNPATSSTWIGASAEGEMLLASTRDTFLGVWVDVPESRPSARPPMDVALVIDTSGSMAGAKIENARNAASTLVKNLKDGDIVSRDSFSDNAKTLVPPTRLDSRSRQQILEAIARLTPTGSTNMFDGLTMGESQVAQAPATHSVRRVVVISDGIANVGPSSPETLGAIAQRGLRFQAQVTSLGVGNDYDERTLDALAVNSSGRLYHLSEPKEMATILKGELDLLDQTLASNAFVEVVPAPGVQLSGADGVRADFSGDGSLRIPLGALHSGQHREALVRVRLVDPEAFTGN